MRQAIITDSHSNEELEHIYQYVGKNLTTLNIDSIVFNGDLLGVKAPSSAAEQVALLRKLAPQASEKLLAFAQEYSEAAIMTDEKKEKLGEAVCEYVKERYEFLFEVLERFSRIRKVHFNFGEHESPLYYKVTEELAALIGIDPGVVKKSILYTPYRNTFQDFLTKSGSIDPKRFRHLSWRANLEGSIIMAGIPGLSASSVPVDSDSELQERMTKELLNTIKRFLSYGDKLIIYNHTEGKISEEPFSYKPGSPAVREFMQEMKGKLRHKVFIQGHSHWKTTSFFTKEGFSFILENAAVNSGLFNILEVSNKVRCFDVDPKNNRITELLPYDSYAAECNSLKDRIKLNYPDAERIISERALL